MSCCEETFTTIPITIYRNTFFSLPLVIVDPAGNIFDLTGWTGKGEVRSLDVIPALLYTLVVNVTDPAAGEVVLSIDQGLTGGQPVGAQGRWDVVFISPSGDRVGPVAGGPAEVRNAVTQFA